MQLSNTDPALAWVSILDAARLLSVSRSAVHKWVQTGKLRAAWRNRGTRPVLAVAPAVLVAIREYRANRMRVPSLADRGVVPEACDGLSGEAIVDWAREEGRDELLVAGTVDDLFRDSALADFPVGVRTPLRAIHEELIAMRFELAMARRLSTLAFAEAGDEFNGVPE